MKRLFAQVASAAFFIAPALAEPQYPTTPPAPPPPAVVILDPATGLPLGTASNPLNTTGGGGPGGSTTPYTPASTEVPNFAVSTSNITTNIPTGATTLIITPPANSSVTAHCTLGAGPATVNSPSIVGPFAFNVTGVTQFSCITSSGSITLNATAGSGAYQGAGNANPSSGITNATAPIIATQLGVRDASGNLQAVGPANPVPTSPFTVSHAATTALASSLSAKTSAGSLLGFNCTAITGGAAGYCVVVNSATTPTTGASITPLDFCSFDTTTRGCSLGRSPSQVAYSAGIQILVTSAASPYTFTTGTDTAAITGDFQ